MAITISLVVVALFGALTDGTMGEPGWDDSGEDWMEVNYRPALQLPQPPALPGFPQIRLPQPPPLPFITFGKNKPRAPHMPRMPFMPVVPHIPIIPVSLPSVEDMLKVKPNPGGKYSGVFVGSSMNSNGEGTAEFASNINGEVMHEKSNYDKPTHKDELAEFPSFGQPIFPKLHKMKSFGFHDFKLPELKLKMEPLDLNKMRTYVPKDKNENYKATSYVSHKSYKNINGKEFFEGGEAGLENDNGKVEEVIRTYVKKP